MRWKSSKFFDTKMSKNDTSFDHLEASSSILLHLQVKCSWVKKEEEEEAKRRWSEIKGRRKKELITSFKCRSWLVLIFLKKYRQTNIYFLVYIKIVIETVFSADMKLKELFPEASLKSEKRRGRRGRWRWGKRRRRRRLFFASPILWTRKGILYKRWKFFEAKSFLFRILC